MALPCDPASGTGPIPPSIAEETLSLGPSLPTSFPPFPPTSSAPVDETSGQPALSSDGDSESASDGSFDSEPEDRDYDESVRAYVYVLWFN